jgi:hypothetical protein
LHKAKLPIGKRVGCGRKAIILRLIEPYKQQ